MDLKRFEYLICRQVHGLGQDHRRHRKALSRRLQAGGPQALHQRQVGRWTAGHGAYFLTGATMGANGSGRGVLSLDTGRIGIVSCG